MHRERRKRHMPMCVKESGKAGIDESSCVSVGRGLEGCRKSIQYINTDQVIPELNLTSEFFLLHLFINSSFVCSINFLILSLICLHPETASFYKSVFSPFVHWFLTLGCFTQFKFLPVRFRTTKLWLSSRACACASEPPRGLLPFLGVFFYILAKPS